MMIGRVKNADRLERIVWRVLKDRAVVDAEGMTGKRGRPRTAHVRRAVVAQLFNPDVPVDSDWSWHLAQLALDGTKLSWEERLWLLQRRGVLPESVCRSLAVGVVLGLLTIMGFSHEDIQELRELYRAHVSQPNMSGRRPVSTLARRLAEQVASARLEYLLVRPLGSDPVAALAFTVEGALEVAEIHGVDDQMNVEKILELAKCVVISEMR